MEEKRSNFRKFIKFDVFISLCLSVIRAFERDISIQFARVNRAHAIESIGAEHIGRYTFHSSRNLMTINIYTCTHAHSNRYYISANKNAEISRLNKIMCE